MFSDIFVTGAAGWLGSRMVELLVAGMGHPQFDSAVSGVRRIHALVQKGQGKGFLSSLGQKIVITEGNLLEPSSIRNWMSTAQGALLIHAAGVIHPRRVRDFYQINLEGTEGLLAEARRNSVARVIVVSSNSPCGVNPHPDHIFDESSPYAPYMNYGRSKMLMEQAILKMVRHDDLDAVIIRPPWFYGPNQPPRQSLFFRMIKDGTVPLLGGGVSPRSMAYIDNICLGIMLAAGSKKSKGQIYWIADERPYSIREVADTITEVLQEDFGIQCKGKQIEVPAIIGDLAELGDSLIQKLGLYHQKIHVLSEMNKTIACSIEKAKAELGYVPIVSLREGMRRSIQWCLENGIEI